MTKEELEKEARVFAAYYESLFPNEFEMFYKAFLKVAEPREKRIAELKKESDFYHREKGEYKAAFLHQVVLTNRVNRKLTEAKELIKDYMIVVNGDHCTVCSVPEENRCIDVSKLNEKAEQFIKENT